MNWKKFPEQKPKRYDELNTLYISCIIWIANPKYIDGGIPFVCRWNIKNNCWLESDLEREALYHSGLKVTHFCDDYDIPK